MDGTLLNSRHEVSEWFIDLFQELQTRGIQFVAASGRQYNSIVDKLETLKNELIFIAENGGLVRKGEEEWLSIPLGYGMKDDILKSLGSVENLYPVICAKNSAYIAQGDTEFLDMLHEYYTQFEMLEDLYEFEGEVMKIAIYHPTDSEIHIYPKVKHFDGELKVKISGKNWVDVSHIDAHKGYALAEVQERLDISPMETMVFGDYNNDLEMLERAYFSYAMANAHPNVKAAARFQTRSNDEMGVERVLEQLLEQLS